MTSSPGVGIYGYTREALCPACESPGELLGDYVMSSEITYDDEETYPVELLVVAAEEFVCPYCGLHLVGPEALVAAELADHFDVEREAEPDWDDYGND